MSTRLQQRADGRVRSKDGLGEACALCGRKTKLRECYFFKPQQRFDKSLFVPRLMEDEKYKLKSGLNSICENRTRCRRSPNAQAQARRADP